MFENNHVFKNISNTEIGRLHIWAQYGNKPPGTAPTVGSVPFVVAEFTNDTAVEKGWAGASPPVSFGAACIKASSLHLESPHRSLHKSS